MCSMMSRRPPNAPTGMPPPTILPSVVRSGLMPYSACAPPSATRKPVITSSKISTLPCWSHTVRSVSRNPGAGSTQFMLPATGSTMMQAISSPTGREQLLHLGAVVVGERQRLRGQLFRHAGRGRHAERERARAGLDQQRVGVAVIAALELDDLVAAGEAARQADRAHGRFGARADHAHQLDRRHQLADPARELGLDLRRRAERQAERGALLHGAHHRLVRVAEDHRAPRADVVDVAAAVVAEHVRAAGALDEHRLAADGAERAHRGIHAAGNVAAGIAEQGHVPELRRAS